MFNSPLLVKYIDKSGYKRSYIANCLELNSYTLAMKINGQSEFKVSEINALCELLNIDADERNEIFFAKQVE